MAKVNHANAGKRNRPAMIEKPAAYSDNGSGGNSAANTYDLVCSPMIHLYSAAAGRGSSRAFRYSQLYPEARHWAELAYRSDTAIDGTMILVHDGRHFQILDAIDIDEEHVTILLPLVEYQAQG